MNKQPKNTGRREAIAVALRRARKAIKAVNPIDDTDRAVADALTDIRHLCHTLDVDFYEACGRSYKDYIIERASPKA
jgi:hypothetical protein